MGTNQAEIPQGENELTELRAEYTRRELLRRSGIVAVATAPVVGLLLPEEAQAQLLGRPSVDQQKKLGQEAAQQVLQKYRVVNDNRARRFADVGARLVNALPENERSKWDYSFRLLESEELNAFALPGGPMFLFTGLYKQMRTVDEMAGVTGHEIGHVRGEHWAKAYGKQAERQLAIGLGLQIFKAGRAAQTIAGGVEGLIGLRYGREQEDESDEKGLINMVAAGYNPKGMLDLFRTLERAGGGKSGPTGDILQNHPLTSKRIKKTEERIASLSRSGRRFPSPTPLA